MPARVQLSDLPNHVIDEYNLNSNGEGEGERKLKQWNLPPQLIAMAGVINALKGLTKRQAHYVLFKVYEEIEKDYRPLQKSQKAYRERKRQAASGAVVKKNTADDCKHNEDVAYVGGRLIGICRICDRICEYDKEGKLPKKVISAGKPNHNRI